MALIHCDFYSDVLGLSTSMTVILPQAVKTQIGMAGRVRQKRHPVLFLLHGLTDDHTIWLRRTSIERYAAPLGLAVVMPAVHRSYYADMARGMRFWTFVSEELPAVARSFFPLSEKREEAFAAGLSMGGYGAFKLALRCPDKFSCAASLSGAVDAATAARHIEGDGRTRRREMANILGDLKKVRGSGNDLFSLAEKLARSRRKKPRLYQCCGKQDFLYADNLRLKKHLERLGMDLTYEEEDAEHEWGYWDGKIRRVLEWLPL